MKKVAIVLVLLILLIGGYFGIKGFYLYYYDIHNMVAQDYNSVKEGLKVKDTMTIKKSDSDYEYLTYKDVKIKNEFKDFELSKEDDDSSDKYILYGENKKVKASFWIGTTDSYVYSLTNDSTLFGTGDKRITNANISNILKKNNINNDLELFKFLSQNEDVKSNIFTPIKQMKENYVLQFMTWVVMPKLDSITLIDGDYEGYILNLKVASGSSVREARIIHDDKTYMFLFLSNDNDYFKDEDINNLLNTVVFE